MKIIKDEKWKGMRRMEKNKEELEAKQMKLLKELAKLSGANIGEKDKNVKDEEKIEKRFKNYIQAFEEEFETNSQERLKQAPLLIRIYRDIMELIYAPSKRYNKAIQTIDKIDKELNKALTFEQKNLLSQKRYCENIITDDLVEMSFVYGYSMSDELRKEVRKTKSINAKMQNKKR